MNVRSLARPCPAHLAAISIPAYIGQQEKAKDTAAQAQLRTAATAQQLHYAQEDAYAADVEALEAHGFRQGDQAVTVTSGGADGYCMEDPGGGSWQSHPDAPHHAGHRQARTRRLPVGG